MNISIWEKLQLKSAENLYKEKKPQTLQTNKNTLI